MIISRHQSRARDILEKHYEKTSTEKISKQAQLQKWHKDPQVKLPPYTNTWWWSLVDKT